MQFETLPDVEDAKRDDNVVSCIRWLSSGKTQWRPWDINQWLLRDLWSIVCSFLWNSDSKYLLSVPLKAIINVNHQRRLNFNVMYFHFVGAEDRKPYKGKHVMMSSRTDFYFHESESLCRRFLVEFELNHVFM